MAARASSKILSKISKKTSEKVTHKPFMRLNIKAGQAAPAPPLGPQLGQRGIQIAGFCKDFNDKTSHIKTGVPIPTRIYVKPDRSYDIVLKSATTTYLLLQAAGIQRGARRPGHEVAGKITVKHVYEIAKIKSKDPGFEYVDLEHICRLVIGSAHTLGIDVVRELDPVEYAQFLVERKQIVEEQDKALEEKRQAKLLRL